MTSYQLTLSEQTRNVLLGHLVRCDQGVPAEDVASLREAMDALGHAKPTAAVAVDNCHCGEPRRVLIEDHCAACIEACRPDLLGGRPAEPTVPLAAVAEVQRVLERDIQLQLESAQAALRHVARTATAEAATIDGGHYQSTDFVAGNAAKYAETLAAIRGLQEALAGVRWLQTEGAQAVVAAPEPPIPAEVSSVCLACRRGTHARHEPPCSCRHVMHRAAA